MKTRKERPSEGREVREGLLIVLSGPGGVGKDTVIDRLLELDSTLRYSVSFTTRPRRDYEVEGEHYTFVDAQRFELMAAAGELLEHTTINGYAYGTSRWRVEDARKHGIDILLKIDVEGAEQVRPQLPDGLFIFLRPPSMEELIRRREARGTESKEDQVRRQELAEHELAFADRYDVVVTNHDVQRAATEILEAIERRRQQPQAIDRRRQQRP